MTSFLCCDPDWIGSSDPKDWIACGDPLRIVFTQGPSSRYRGMGLFYLSAYANEFASLPNKKAPHYRAGPCDPDWTLFKPLPGGFEIGRRTKCLILLTLHFHCCILFPDFVKHSDYLQIINVMDVGDSDTDCIKIGHPRRICWIPI